MGRWEPGTKERLQSLALELFLAHGFEETTVAEIAEKAGVTERTFFRYFADKREVLFSGQDEFEHLFLTGVRDADDGPPMANSWVASLPSRTPPAAASRAATSLSSAGTTASRSREWQVVRMPAVS